VLAQALSDQVAERVVREVAGGLLEVGARVLRGCGGLERGTAGDHLVEYHPEGVDVGAAVHGVPAELLGGHVPRAADDAAVVARGAARDAEVHQLRHHADADALADHDVRGLHVGVHDAQRVRGLQGRPDLQRHGQRVASTERALGEQGGQRSTVDQLHHQIGRAVVGASEVVHLHDVGVLQRAGRPRLLHEPPVAVVLAGLVEQLDRDGSSDAQLLGPVHRAHAAGAESGAEAVAGVEEVPGLGGPVGHRGLTCHCGRSTTRPRSGRRCTRTARERWTWRPTR
jgi:hypothetical protein